MIKLQLKNNIQNKLPALAKVSVVNNLLSSLLKDVTVSVNGVQVENTNQLYPYKSMFTLLLNYDTDNLNSQFEASGFYNKLDVIGEEMKEICANSATFEVAGPLFLDIFTQSKYILPNTEIRLKFTFSNQNFILKEEIDAKLKTSYTINDMTLYVRTANVHHSVALAHNHGLLSNNAIYPYQKCEMKYFNIAMGSSSFSQENLFGNIIPKFLCFGMVNNNAFNGSKSLNPFNFQHFNTNFIGLYRNGTSVGKELTPDFKNKNCAREYIQMLAACNLYGKNASNSISFTEYKNNGYSLFAYNLTPDLESGSQCKQVNMFGNLRLDLRFDTALIEAINVIVMGIFDGEMQITKDGHVLI